MKEIAILGAGGRGTGFGELLQAQGHRAKVVAVAEPRDSYRERFAQAHGLSAGRVFKDWREFVARPRMADAAIISTLDREHVGPAVKCLELGYDVLIEKPMGVTLEECQAIAAAQRTSGRIVGVCHSLRYQKGFRKLKELVAGGAVGRVMTIDHIEQVEYGHQVHSFVRGNWGNSARSTFMLLAKSCHDLDYLAWLVGEPCVAVSSFGALSYFTRANAPAGSGERCLECAVEAACPLSAVKQYVQTNRERWWANMVSADHSYAAHLEAIRTGPYGRCAWKCDNDAVDHQVVALQFGGDVTATFTMTAFTAEGGRKIRVHGTQGEIFFDERSITVKTFADRNVTRVEIGPEQGGHGGGDSRVVSDWLTALETRDDSVVVANAQESLRTHAMVFAAEKSRLEGRMVRMEEMGG